MSGSYRCSLSVFCKNYQEYGLSLDTVSQKCCQTMARLFTSAEFQEFLKQMDITSATSFYQWPGERDVLTFKVGLMAYSLGEVETCLSLFLFCYHTKLHSTTGVSLAELLMGLHSTTGVSLAELLMGLHSTTGVSLAELLMGLHSTTGVSLAELLMGLHSTTGVSLAELLMGLHSTTGVSLAELLMGLQVRTHLDLLKLNIADWI